MIRIEHLGADVLELKAFARAAISGRIDAKLVPVPRTLDAIVRPDDRFTPDEREELSRALSAGLAPLQPHVAVVDSLRALARPGASAIVTGQQPGFLTSPLYSLWKALQSIRLALVLSERWDAPVVPLFWNHADDHDLAEVHHAYVLNENLDLQKVALAGLASGKQPLSRIVLRDDAHKLAAIRSMLAQLHEGEPHATRALEMFVPKDGETFARAFTRSMTELCGPFGLVVVEPDWIRTQLSRELARVVGHDPMPHLLRGAQRLREAGHEVATDPAEAAVVFRVDAKGRAALRAGGDGFRYDGEDGSRTAAELAAEIQQEPLAWSSGALLRPIVQDLALPVAAYVGGFGELAYHAELGDLRDATKTPRTAFVPRISFTLVDPECRQSLARLETDVESILRARGSFTAKEQDDAPPVLAQMSSIAKDAATRLSTLRAELAALDPGLAVQLKRTCDQIQDLVDKLAEKGARVHQNKSGKGRRHERRVNNLLFPRNEPQERVLGPLPFVARFGEDWIRELLLEIDPLAPEHMVVHLAADRDITDKKIGDAT